MATPNLFINTSLDNVTLPPRSDMPISQRERQRRQAQHLLRRQARRANQELRDSRLEMLEIRRQGDLCFDRLQAHQASRPPIARQFITQLRRCAKYELVQYERIRKHIRNALIISDANVRRYDIIGWISMPNYLREPYRKLRKHFHEEAILRLHLKHNERSCNHDEHWKSDEEFAGAVKPDDRYGLERALMKNGVWHYYPRYEGRKRLVWIRASFEARQVLWANKSSLLYGSDKDEQVLVYRFYSRWLLTAIADAKNIAQADKRAEDLAAMITKIIAPVEEQLTVQIMQLEREEMPRLQGGRGNTPPMGGFPRPLNLED